MRRTSKKWVLAAGQVLVSTLLPVKHTETMHGWVMFIVTILVFLGLVGSAAFSVIVPEIRERLPLIISSGIGLLLLLKATQLQKQINDQTERQPPKNRDALISAFTGLGERALYLSNARQADAGFRKMFDGIASDEKRDAIRDAEHFYREARIATRKEINIAGGLLGQYLWFALSAIQGRIMEDRFEMEEGHPLERPSPSIDDAVKKAIAAIDRGEATQPTPN